MVTQDDLSKVYADLWYQEERVVPWALADLSGFQPTLEITVPRKDFEYVDADFSQTLFYRLPLIFFLLSVIVFPPFSYRFLFFFFFFLKLEITAACFRRPKHLPACAQSLWQ